MDQPGKVANPARGQLNRENEYSPVPCPRRRLRRKEVKDRGAFSGAAMARCWNKGLGAFIFFL